jgi:hypothetical protein
MCIESPGACWEVHAAHEQGADGRLVGGWHRHSLVAWCGRRLPLGGGLRREECQNPTIDKMQQMCRACADEMESPCLQRTKSAVVCAQSGQWLAAMLWDGHSFPETA